MWSWSEMLAEASRGNRYALDRMAMVDMMIIHGASRDEVATWFIARDDRWTRDVVRSILDSYYKWAISGGRKQ